jgi:hypothetical protein
MEKLHLPAGLIRLILCSQSIQRMGHIVDLDVVGLREIKLALLSWHAESQNSASLRKEFLMWLS